MYYRSGLSVALSMVVALLPIASLGKEASEALTGVGSSILKEVVVKTPTYQDYYIGRALGSRKAALLIFPGTWDPYSIHSLKVLRNIEADLADLDVQIFAVTSSSPLMLQKLLETHEIPFLVTSDQENKVARLLGATEFLSSRKVDQLKKVGIGIYLDRESGKPEAASLRLYLFRNDGLLLEGWEPSIGNGLISADEIIKMAAQLDAPP